MNKVIKNILTATASIFFVGSTFAYEDPENITINPENAASFGVRLYVVVGIERTTFSVRSMDEWAGYSYLNQFFAINNDQDYVSYSASVGCLENHVYGTVVEIDNHLAPSTYLNLIYKSPDNKLRSLNISFLQYIKYIKMQPELRDSFWEDGVGPNIDKEHLPFFEKREVCL